MNNRSAGPRSFNTIQRSNRGARLRRLQEMRILLLAICALILLLALTGLVFLFCHLGHSLSAGGGGGGSSGKVEYGQLSVLPTSEDATVSIYRGNLIVVNKDRVYHFPSTRLENMTAEERRNYEIANYRVSVGTTTPYYLLLNKKNYMVPEAAEAINRLLTDFYNLSQERLYLYESYRTEEDQKGSDTLPPGHSDQHTGLSAAISSDGGTCKLDAGKYSSLYAMCAKYGFIQRYPSSLSQETGVSGYGELFRYVGVPHAQYITAQNLSLEGYIEQLRTSHKYDGSHLLLDASGNRVTKDAAYEIYYVAVSGDSASVPVPKNYNYTISGDNIGGFIVTVNLNSPK